MTPLVIATRSGFTEEIHRGSIVVIKNDKIHSKWGNNTHLTPMRSTAKPFQILPLIKLGGIERYSLSKEEVAIMVSSHNGEAMHINVIKALAKRANIDISDINCGVHPPFFSKINGYNELPIYNNCSGKHLSMLLLCRLMNISHEGYDTISHTIQQMIIREIVSLLNINESLLEVGIDGCGVPTYFVKLEQLAKLYYILSISTRNNFPELYEIRKSILKAPFMTAGSNRIETIIMENYDIIIKCGAQGIMCVSIPEHRMGIAIKIESGSDRAAECAVVTVLEKLGIISSEFIKMYAAQINSPILTTLEKPVGKYLSIF
jgi:L-asparaginase II